MDKFDQLAAERTALGQDFQNLAGLATDLNHRADEAHVTVSKLEAHAANLHASAVGRIAEFDVLIDNYSAQLCDRLASFTTAAATSHDQFDKAFNSMRAQWDALDERLVQTTTLAKKMTKRTDELAVVATKAIQATIVGIGSDSKTMELETAKRIAEVAGFDGGLVNLSKDWATLLDQIAVTLRQANDAVGALLKDQLDDILGSFADQFHDVLAQIAEDDVRQVTDSLTHEARQNLEQTMTAAVDQAIALLGDGLKQAMDELLTSKALTDNESKMMLALVQPIRPLIEDFIGKVIVTRGIWDVVKPFM